MSTTAVSAFEKVLRKTTGITLVAGQAPKLVVDKPTKKKRPAWTSHARQDDEGIELSGDIEEKLDHFAEDDVQWSTEAAYVRQLADESESKKRVFERGSVISLFHTLQLRDLKIEEIGADFRGFLNLEELSLSANNISTLHVQHLPGSISVLNLYGNKLSEIPKSLFSRCAGLLHVGLGMNKLTDAAIQATFAPGNTIPPAWLSLVSLDLGYNLLTDLEGTLSVIGSALPNVQVLVLMGNPFFLSPNYHSAVKRYMPQVKLLDDATAPWLVSRSVEEVEEEEEEESEEKEEKSSVSLIIEQARVESKSPATTKVSTGPTITVQKGESETSEAAPRRYQAKIVWPCNAWKQAVTLDEWKAVSLDMEAVDGAVSFNFTCKLDVDTNEMHTALVDGVCIVIYESKFTSDGVIPSRSDESDKNDAVPTIEEPKAIPIKPRRKEKDKRRDRKMRDDLLGSEPAASHRRSARRDQAATRATEPTVVAPTATTDVSTFTRTTMPVARGRIAALTLLQPDVTCVNGTVNLDSLIMQAKPIKMDISWRIDKSVQ